ncbi:MAG: hypothetical protein HY017_13500 [Betaproteobacteria bacterium]|nr:hypothetical protein [Betaproteobacteria bacterium]
MDTTTDSRVLKTPNANAAIGSGALASANTLLLTRSDVERLLTPEECIAAVGADNEYKQEIDLLEQCCAIGDLHHAIAAGLMKPSGVHAQLGEIIAGFRPGRTRDDEITVFDSSGTALQDVAAAAAVYRRALGQQQGVQFSFNA